MLYDAAYYAINTIDSKAEKKKRALQGAAASRPLPRLDYEYVFFPQLIDNGCCYCVEC